MSYTAGRGGVEEREQTPHYWGGEGLRVLKKGVHCKLCTLFTLPTRHALHTAHTAHTLEQGTFHALYTLKTAQETRNSSYCTVCGKLHKQGMKIWNVNSTVAMNLCRFYASLAHFLARKCQLINTVLVGRDIL